MSSSIFKIAFFVWKEFLNGIKGAKSKIFKKTRSFWTNLNRISLQFVVILAVRLTRNSTLITVGTVFGKPFKLKYVGRSPVGKHR